MIYLTGGVWRRDIFRLHYIVIDSGGKVLHFLNFSTRKRLKASIKKILEEGTASGEFNPVDIDATTKMLIAMLNGLMRQQVAGMDSLKGVEGATIEFCRKAFVANKLF